MASAELITQAEYARRRGVDPTTVRDAIKAGRITLIDGKVDPAVADIQWQRNTRARVNPARAPGSAPAPMPQHQMSLSAAAAAASQPADGPAQADPAGESDYWVSRARREHAEADLAELKLAEQNGQLIRVEAIRSALAGVISSTRDSLLQLPARLAPVLAAETDAAKVHDLIQAEIHQALAQITAAPDRITTLVAAA